MCDRPRRKGRERGVDASHAFAFRVCCRGPLWAFVADALFSFSAKKYRQPDRSPFFLDFLFLGDRVGSATQMRACVVGRAGLFRCASLFLPFISPRALWSAPWRTVKFLFVTFHLPAGCAWSGNLSWTVVFLSCFFLVWVCHFLFLSLCCRRCSQNYFKKKYKRLNGPLPTWRLLSGNRRFFFVLFPKTRPKRAAGAAGRWPLLEHQVR